MTDNREPDPVDAVARQLVGALLCGLVMVVPLRTALGASGRGAVFVSVLGAVLLAILAGRLLAMAGVPYAIETSLAVMGLFGVAALIALATVSLLGDPGDATEVSLLAGLPAAAAAAAGAVALLHSRSRDPGPALIAGLVGPLVVLVAAGPVGGLFAEARDDAAEIQFLAEAGLTPYLPDLEGLDGEFSGNVGKRPEGGWPRQVTGYLLRYHQQSPPGGDSGAAYLDVEVALADGAACEESLGGSFTCVKGDGFVVREYDGVPEAVVAEHGDIRLVAIFREGDGGLPEPGEVGQALADSDIVEWDDVVGLDD